jgi:hypothetical protein
MGQPNLTERQRKYFASMQASLEARTGKSFAQWVEIARTCPETGHRARLKWFKDTHGLLQNSASLVLGEAFPSNEPGWDEDAALRQALWTDPASTAILDRFEPLAKTLPELVPTQRKGYTAWSREYQFAALRPMKGGAARLGLAVEPTASPRLVPAKNEGWSERLKASMPLSSPADVDAEVDALLRQAWERS